MSTILQRIADEKYHRLSLSARSSFKDFIYASWPEVERATPMVSGWHIDAIAEHLQALYDGTIKKLAISVPPRHMKSTMVSVMFPAWVWIQQPGSRFLTASYRDGLAVRDALRSRELMETTWYKSYFGKIFQFSTKQDTKSYYKNNYGGYRMTTSVQGGATGEGGNYVGVDDPHNITDATSNAERMRVLNWWDMIMASRLNDQTEGRMFIIGQRVHENDLIGHVILTKQGYEYLRLPAEYEAAKKTYTSIGWEDPRKEEGEVLWAAKFDKKVLAALKTVLQQGYYAQYQQSPARTGGNILKDNMFRRYSRDGDGLSLYDGGEGGVPTLVDLKRCRIFITSDLAISKKQTADFTVFAAWAITHKTDVILLDIIRGHFDGPESEQALHRLADQYRRKLSGIIIEDVAYQKDFLQRIQYAGYPVISYKPTSDKIARANDIAIYFNNGQFYFPNTQAAWLVEYERELLDFPVAPNDDQMDATSILTVVLGSAKARIRDFQEGKTDHVSLRRLGETTISASAYDVELNDLPELAHLQE